MAADKLECLQKTDGALFFPPSSLFFPPAAVFPSGCTSRTLRRPPGLRLVDLLVRCQRAGGPKSVPCAAPSRGEAVLLSRWRGSAESGRTAGLLLMMSITNMPSEGIRWEAATVWEQRKRNHACFSLMPRDTNTPPTHPPTSSLFTPLV